MDTLMKTRFNMRCTRVAILIVVTFLHVICVISCARESLDKRVIERVEEERQIRLDEQFKRCLSYYDEKDYDTAISEFTKYLEIDPNNAKALCERGRAYFEKNNYEMAISDWSNAIKIDPHNARFYANRAGGYKGLGNDHNYKTLDDYSKTIDELELGNYHKAIDDYTTAIDIDPNYRSLYYFRGQVYEKMKDYDNAIADYTIEIQKRPKYKFAYRERGKLYELIGDYDAAIADYTELIKLDAKTVRAYGLRAGAYFKKGDYEKSIYDFTKQLQFYGDDWADHIYVMRAEAYEYLGDYESAINDYIKLIDLLKDYYEKPNADKPYIDQEIKKYNKNIKRLLSVNEKRD